MDRLQSRSLVEGKGGERAEVWSGAKFRVLLLFWFVVAVELFNLAFWHLTPDPSFPSPRNETLTSAHWLLTWRTPHSTLHTLRSQLSIGKHWEFGHREAVVCYTSSRCVDEGAFAEAGRAATGASLIKFYPRKQGEQIKYFIKYL